MVDQIMKVIDQITKILVHLTKILVQTIKVMNHIKLSTILDQINLKILPIKNNMVNNYSHNILNKDFKVNLKEDIQALLDKKNLQ